MSTGHAQYVLWRRDADGNITLVGRYHSREQAQRVCQSLRRRHDHSYWITPLRTGGL